MFNMLVVFLLVAEIARAELFQPFRFSFNEGARELNDLEGKHHRAFRQMREQNRQDPIDWGFGDLLVEKAIAMGEMSCRSFMIFDNENNRNREQQLSIRDVQVFDDYTGEEYPVIINGFDFVAYNPELEKVNGRQHIKIIIKHTGCQDVPVGCWAETTYHSFFHNENNDERIPFAEMNLALRRHEVQCSVWRRVFGIWPFSGLFN
ncbi:unnamed protein product [Caenorhabditis brenneri]